MPIYRCQQCDYTTPKKTNYLRHLNSQKHFSDDTINRYESDKLPKNGKICPILTPNLAKIGKISTSLSILFGQDWPLFGPWGC